MKKELDEQLVKKYPKIFKNRFGDMKETAMCWGFECRDGWYWLIDNLCGTVQNYLDSNVKGVNLIADQVKEKFGGLRFYYHIEGIPEDEHKKRNLESVDGMFWLAESLSYSICEVCGSMEEVSQTEGGWIETICKKCMEKK